jgi:hypothetical protein
MEIPGLGRVTFDERCGWYVSEPLPIPVLGGAVCSVTVEGYDEDEAKEDFHAAVEAFLALDADGLRSASGPVFEYYEDVRDEVGDEPEFVSIGSPDEVWEHIQLGSSVAVGRRDGAVYVAVESECAWQPEDGVLIVLRGGREVTKVGPFDGQFTNERDGVVYERFG